MKALESKSMVLLRHHLKTLRLPTIGAECEKVARRAAADNVDHLTYLLQVTELELLERERKAAERRLKAARFPSLKSLESFDFTARPSVNKALVAELARGEFIDRRENVLLVGNPGTGKTHLAIGLSAAACARGYRVPFLTSPGRSRDECGTRQRPQRWHRYPLPVRFSVAEAKGTLLRTQNAAGSERLDRCSWLGSGSYQDYTGASNLSSRP